MVCMAEHGKMWALLPALNEEGAVGNVVEGLRARGIPDRGLR